MPIGLVEDDDFNKELERLSGTTRTQKVVPSIEVLEKESHGRNKGDLNVPESLRKIIGEESVINGRQSALGLAGMFGISPSSVSAYARGATSTTSYNQPKQGIIDHINKSRHRAIGRASKTMNRALDAITQDKLDYTDAKDLISNCKRYVGRYQELGTTSTSNTSTEQTNQPQFVIFAPQFRDERSFETINVNE